MIVISGVISIIIQKNTSCTNKIRVIYFCPNCVNFLPENVYLFIFWWFIPRLALESHCFHGHASCKITGVVIKIDLRTMGNLLYYEQGCHAELVNSPFITI